MADNDHRNPQRPEGTRIRNSQLDEAEQRRARRLARDLGINPAGVQVVLHLRRQLVALQARVQQLESDLKTEQARSHARFARYRQEFHEAITSTEY
jgi:DNA-binding transcriptional MerR regulator